MALVESRSWGAVIKEAAMEQVERREMSEFEARVVDKDPVRIHTEEEEGIHYMGAWGQFWDEVSNRKLDRNGVMSARL